jgi:hypothetical protein
VVEPQSIQALRSYLLEESIARRVPVV